MHTKHRMGLLQMETTLAVLGDHRRSVAMETTMPETMLMLAVTDTIWSRLGVCAVASLVGAILIFTGLQNIKTRTAEESGKRRLVNKAIGQSNTYEGSKAVMIGWVRVVCGVGAIIFGIVFIFVGPFLAK